MKSQDMAQLIMLRGLLATAKAVSDPEVVKLAEERAAAAVLQLNAQFAACEEVDKSGVTGFAKDVSDLTRLLITAEVVELVAKIQ